MNNQDTIAARKTLAPLTEAQIKDMDENSYFGALIFKVDEEIQRLEALAQPDDVEADLRKKVQEDPENLDNYFIGKRIGQGAYAVVRLGLHKMLN